MKRGTLLPVGTQIRIGRNPQIHRTAFDLVCALRKPLIWEEGSYIQQAEIIENPNRWLGNAISHSINFKFDKVHITTNKEAKISLERLDD